ncbi:MAG: hypothetical protein GQ570_13530 [Helicobacteraceae bacterium]|nr:hypothetical protein [Helicobacteraceae bacterium]
MSKNIQKSQKKFTSELVDFVTEFNHRYARYDLNYSLTLIYSRDEVDFNSFESEIRKTDRFLLLEDNLCALLFDNTAGSGAIKAADNMLTKYEAKHFGKPVYAASVSINDYNTSTEMISKLFYILRNAIDLNIENKVVDKEDIESAY